MDIIFLGEGPDAQEMLEWTYNSIGNTSRIIGVSGDDSVQKYANSVHIQVYSLKEIQSKCQNSMHVDLVLSFLYGKIIKKELIRCTTYGCINFHPAPLPDYKGRAGCSFAILDHLSQWGCTAHFIDEGIDTGPIIDVKKFAFDWRMETGYSLKKKTTRVLKELFKETVSTILQNKRINSYCQQMGVGKYISKDDMLAAMEIHEGDDIDAKIQAFWYPPHDGAYLLLNGTKYTLINRVVLEQLQEMIK